MRLDVLLHTVNQIKDPPQPNQDPKSQNQIKDLIACRFMSALHDWSPIRPKKNHIKKLKKEEEEEEKRTNLHHHHRTIAIGPTIHDHNHQITAINSPQSPEHTHRRSTEREERRKKRERKEKDRRERAVMVNKKEFFFYNPATVWS